MSLNNSEIFISYFLTTIFFLLLLLHGDIESNPSPKKKEQTYFSLCHWNVNSLVAHKKTSLLAAYNSVYRYEIICISDSFLGSTISDDGNILHMEGYNIIRADHPDNIKGGVCLYFKKSLALRKIELSHITECLLCEVNVKGQVGFIIVSYRSPSQTTSQFDGFLSNFEKLFDDV